MRELVRAYAPGGMRSSKKTALTPDPQYAKVATCTDGVRGLRDSALLQARLCQCRPADLGDRGQGDGTAAVRCAAGRLAGLLSLRTWRDQGEQTDTADDRLKPIMGAAAVVALRTYLEAFRHHLVAALAPDAP